jgi:hypothetical protein
MRRSTLLIAAVAVAGLLATPGLASADPGWRLPTVTGVEDNRVYTSSGNRCGKSKFGVWKLRNGLKLPGRKGYVVYRVKLTRNRRLHEPHLIRFGGNLGNQVKQRTRRLLRNVRFRYNAGPPKTAQSVRRNGNIQATRPFDPVRRRC